MATPQEANFGLYHTWGLGASGWNTENNANLKKIGAFMFLSVISATTTAEPGSPSDGDRYIVPTSATGTNWAGQDGTVAVYEVDTWVFYTPAEGWEARAEDTNQPWLYTSTAWSLKGATFGSYADDSAAATGGVPVGGFYVNSSTGALTVRQA
jgi:hypothetical protein